MTGGADEPHGGEAQLRELADNTPALMWMSDVKGRITFVNEGWRRFTGRTMADDTGDTWASSAHPEDREEMNRRWQEAVDARERFHMEYRLRTAGGSYRWVSEVGLPRHEDGEFVGYVGTATDVHERHTREEWLRDSESHFREVANTAPALMWMTDTAGKVTFVNDGWLRFTGTSLAQELGDSWELGVHPDDARALMAAWDAALAQHAPLRAEYRLRRADGRYHWVLDQGVPRFDGHEFVGYVGVATDIHERKRMETELRRVYEVEHNIAETLQRSLLPQALPHIDGLQLAARYLPAEEGAAVGGDWYDVIELADGRVALVVGDVVGHGARAAAVMGQLRNAFRAYALIDGSPAETLTRLNRLMAASGEEAMATALFLVLDRETGDVTWVSAGHPPPLVVADGDARFLEAEGSVPIGAAARPVFRPAHDSLAPGATLLMFTDGLVERRGEPLEGRLEALAATAARGRTDDLELLCDELLAAGLDEAGPADDVALLAVHLEPVEAGVLSMTLPAEPDALATLRRRLDRFLAPALPGEVERYEVVLTVSEVAGNAIEHAYGPGDATFEVDVRLGEEELTAEVRDSGTWRERRGDTHGRGLSIVEGLMDEVEVDRGPSGTTVRLRRDLQRRRAEVG
jgi:PAS domain S-box-containing protein